MGSKTGPNFTDPGELGSKRHLIVDGRRTPLALRVSRAANRHNSMLSEEAIDAMSPVVGQRGRPCRRRDKVHADKGCDYPKCRRALTQRGIAVRVARRGIDCSERLGRYRWVVERTHSWFAGFGKLRIRFEAGELGKLLVYRERPRRELEDYRCNAPPHVRAARMADENDKRLGRALQYGGSSRTRISYVITTAGAQPLEMRHAPIGFHRYIER